MTRTCWLMAWLAVLATATPRAFAQPASVQAQSLFDEGRKLLRSGKLAEACAAFEGSQKLDPAITTLLNLADCREQNHQLATAWGTFVDANRMARSSNDSKLMRIASKHAQKLEPRLSKLTILVLAERQIPGLEILRSNETVDPASWNHALPVDGGTYTITARAPGREPWSTTRTIKIEADAQTVEIPELIDAKPAPPSIAVSRAADPAEVVAPASAVAPATPTPGPASPADEPESVHARTLPIVVGAGALALGGAALAFHLWGNSTYDRAKASTNQDERDNLYHSANTRRYFAEGVGVAALGSAGVAVYLYTRSRGEHRADTAAVTPVASPQFAGLTVVGSW